MYTTSTGAVNLRSGESLLTFTGGGVAYANPTFYDTYDTRAAVSCLQTKVDMLDDTIKQLWRENDKLKAENAKLMEMIEAMWYCPGMPGAPEAPDHPSFKK